MRMRTGSMKTGDDATEVPSWREATAYSTAVTLSSRFSNRCTWLSKQLMGLLHSAGIISSRKCNLYLLRVPRSLDRKVVQGSQCMLHRYLQSA